LLAKFRRTRLRWWERAFEAFRHAVPAGTGQLNDCLRDG